MTQRLFRVLLLLVPIALLASCAGGGKRFESAWSASDLKTGAYRTETVEDFRAALEKRTQKHSELWVKADVLVKRESKAGKEFFTAKAMHRAPDRIRLSGSRNPVGTVFDVLILGQEAHMYFPREGQRFDGTLAELTAKSAAIGGFGPGQLVSAVLVSQELRDRFEGNVPVGAVPQDDEHLLLASRDSKGKQLFWLVRRADGLIEEVLVRDAAGAEELRIRYRSYRMEKDQVTGAEEPLPHRFTIHVAREGVTVEATVGEYRIGTPLPEKAFEVPRAREVNPMRLLKFEGSP